MAEHENQPEIRIMVDLYESSAWLRTNNGAYIIKSYQWLVSMYHGVVLQPLSFDIMNYLLF